MAKKKKVALVKDKRVVINKDGSISTVEVEVPPSETRVELIKREKVKQSEVLEKRRARNAERRKHIIKS